MTALLPPPPGHYYADVPAPTAVPAVDEGEVSLLALLTVVLRYRRLILGVSLALGAASVIIGLVQPRQWSAAAVFVPQARSGGGAAAGGLSGIAAQFGVAVPGAEPTQSPAFYQDLLRSREILGAIADSGVAGPGGRRSVADLYGVRPGEPALRRDLAIRALGENLDAGVSPKTGIIRLTVHAPDPLAAEQLATRALAEVTRFNLQTRQSQAAAERRFVGQRLETARADLRAAEARLRDFMDANRVISSAGLSFERERLARDVAMRQEVFATLSQSFERARIDEVRDTPVITVIESPERPVRADPRRLAAKLLLSLVGGAILGIVVAFVLDFLRAKHGASAGERAEFRALAARGAR